MRPSLATGDRYDVALIGEALGEEEVKLGRPFVGPAGFRLTRMIDQAGLDRGMFDIYNTAWCRPPFNMLEGTEYEGPATAHCRTAHWGSLLSRAQVLVPMGNVPLQALLGRKGILSIRGYVQSRDGHYILPTVHPSYIQRGNSNYAAAFINDIQKAVTLARDGLQVEAKDYIIDPSPQEAYQWAQAYSHSGYPRLAYDIETPGKGEDEGSLDPEDGGAMIWRIGFSHRHLSAMTIPFEPPYFAAIRTLLESPGEKVVWNAGFDNPRLLSHGFRINGQIHDGMVAWHILHSDLPKGLGFVSTFTCPWQTEWKSLSVRSPGFYNCTDADVELRSMDVIEGELRRVGLWGVYERDVLEVDPILIHMSAAGMPLDGDVRYDRAVQLATKQTEVLAWLEDQVPLGARTIEHVFVRTPAVVEGLRSRPSTRRVRVCERCGAERPKKDHTKTYKKKVNPCAGSEVLEREVEVEEWYRLQDFKPSREQLIRYQEYLHRPVPTKWDKKTRTRKKTMDEKALKGLIRKYGEVDKLYERVIEYRELDKIAGTYIGRPADAVSE